MKFRIIDVHKEDSWFEEKEYVIGKIIDVVYQTRQENILDDEWHWVEDFDGECYYAIKVEEVKSNIDVIVEAFVDVLDGTNYWEDIQRNTGCSDEICKEIFDLYKECSKTVYK